MILEASTGDDLVLDTMLDRLGSAVLQEHHPGSAGSHVSPSRRHLTPVTIRRSVRRLDRGDDSHEVRGQVITGRSGSAQDVR